MSLLRSCRCILSRRCVIDRARIDLSLISSQAIWPYGLPAGDLAGTRALQSICTLPVLSLEGSLEIERPEKERALISGPFIH
jgi:hypothetical protein